MREAISLTGQFAAVDEILTGRENLVLVARLRHLAEPGRIADDLLARFSLADAGGRRVATYSGGMRRRLDLAMSLIGDPQVVVLDEPTTGLDPQARLEVWAAVRELAGRGTTVLLTTQHLEEAEQLAERIAILHGGRIVVDGHARGAEAAAAAGDGRVRRAAAQPRGRVPRRGRGRRGRGCRRRAMSATPSSCSAAPCAHVTRSLDTIITTAVMPIAFLLLFVYVFGGAIEHRHRQLRRLPAARHPADHRRHGDLLHRLPAVHLDLKSGIFERFQSMPIARSAVLWAHVLTSLVANLVSLVVVVLVALLMGFRSGAGVAAWLAVLGILVLFTLALTWLAVVPGLTAQSVGRRDRVLLPAGLPAVRQLGVRPDRHHARPGARPSPSTSR